MGYSIRAGNESAEAVSASVDPRLIIRARELLNRARVMSETPAVPPQGGDIARGHPSSAPPPRRETSTLDRLGYVLTRAVATGDSHRVLDAIDWAEQELRLITHGPKRVPETPDQRNYRILVEYDGRHYTDVAETEGLHPTTVWKLRVRNSRDGIWGKLPEVA